MTQSKEKRLVSPSSTVEKNLGTSRPSLWSGQRRILTVGDGNFSYSLALAKAHKSRGNETLIQLTATSYDSYEELIAKYPESKRICHQLKDLGATVLHRIDATNIRESLVAAGAEQKLQFDSVVFNHPHCGEEDVRRHQSLLSHFYASALEVLDKENDGHSEILVTLADGQPERWQVVQRALSAGLKLYRQVDDVDNDALYGITYERKRHQNGKSFHQVTLHGEKKKQISTLFIFQRQEGGTILENTAVSVVVDEETTMTRCRKRKAEKELHLKFACTRCEKSFKCAQGLRTHVHMMHELQVDGAGTKVLLPCSFCDRTFKNEDARRQHQVAKHGNDPLIKPDWFERQQLVTASSAIDTIVASPVLGKEVDRLAATTLAIATPEAKTCSICELAFTSEEDFDAHWQKLQPRATAKRECSRCSRKFDEERALRQHQNFCN